MKITEEFKRNLIAFYENDPFIQFLKFSIADLRVGQVALEVQADSNYANALHIVHGGLLMTLADTAMGASCMTLNKKVVTLDINFNFMKAIVLQDKIKAKAHVLHDGNRTMVTEAEIFNEAGQMCVKGRGTFFVVEKFML